MALSSPFGREAVAADDAVSLVSVVLVINVCFGFADCPKIVARSWPEKALAKAEHCPRDIAGSTY
jgi:hypothetical protein